MRYIIALILVIFAIGAALCLADDLQLDLISVINGQSDTENMGYGVQSPGDLNSNGYSEVFVGSLGDRIVKVFDGGIPGDTLPLLIYENSTGTTMNWLNDINGDGFIDFAIFTWIFGETKQYEIYFGDSNFYDKTVPDLIIPADYEEGFGRICNYDYNSDKMLDIIIETGNATSPIEVKFYFYHTFPNLDSIPDDSLIIDNSVTNGDHFSGACVGDVNNDGFSDYVVTTHSNSIPGYFLLFWGSEELDSVPDIQIRSPFVDGVGIGFFAYHAYPLNDINKDGYDDFIVTSTSGPPCIFYGGDPFDTIPKILEFGEDPVSNCGDINHDGWDDIVVSDTDYDYGYGIVYVYFGAYDMDTIADIIIPYSSLPVIVYEFGKSVNSAGDFNGDGVDDLAIGCDASINQNYNEGRLLIFAGDRNLPTPAEDEGETPLPQKYNILNQNYPNPFNNQTVIEYELWGVFNREIELSIFNILGQNVRTLYQGMQTGGRHFVYWDGKDNNDRAVSSGMYFYRLSSQNEIISKKMIYLK